ncbi:hypothetical protein ACA910_015098 [Epithemia clementina (nom. ined.)]
MLGFAFSEAHRSQEIMRKLHNQKANGGLGSTGDSGSQDNGLGNGQKRARRRRRTKKPSSGGGVPVRTGPRPVGVPGRPITTARPITHTSSGNYCLKQHASPMKRRDLHVALRCGMVSTGVNGGNLAAARVTVVNWDNQVVMDTFVKVPPEEVFDYHTEQTGITAELLAMTSALQFNVARAKVGNLIRGKILIGHGLEVDLGALNLTHPGCETRDLMTYPPFMRKVCDGQSTVVLPRKMDDLMNFVFGRILNSDRPTLLREAVGCMELYKHARFEWERELITAIQRKKQQREFIMNMRMNGGMQLSAIKENDTMVTGMDGLKVSGSRFSFPDKFDYEDATYTTMASTAEHVDDYSEQASFLTQETDPAEAHSFFQLRRVEQDYSPAHADNMSDLSSVYDAEEHEDVHKFTVPSTGIWSQNPQLASLTWYEDSQSHAMLPTEFGNNLVQSTSSLPIVEEELLPSQLLADIDVESRGYHQPRVLDFTHENDVDSQEEMYHERPRLSRRGSRRESCLVGRDGENVDSSDVRASVSGASGPAAKGHTAATLASDNAASGEDAQDYGYVDATDYRYNEDDGHSDEENEDAPECPQPGLARRRSSSGNTQREAHRQLRRNKSDELDGQKYHPDAPTAPEDKKKSWFGLGRRRRSIAESSLSNSDRVLREETIKTEPLSNSDRTHSRNNLLSNDQWLDAEVSPPKFSVFRRNSLSQSPSTKPRTTRPPPGFGS